MESSEIFHADWCRSIFALVAEGGTWGVPRSGLLFRKQDGKLVLYAEMPYDPAMPITPEQLREQQDSEFESIRRHFAAADVEVTKG
jgi:hypothetical protein